MVGTTAARIGHLGAGLVVCSLLAGCGAVGTAGFEPESQTTNPNSMLQKLGNLVAFNKLFPGAAPLPQSEQAVECPIIEVRDGTASVRTYAGEQSNGNVRYGFSLGDVARECSRAGNALVLKVGAEGRVLLGPAGASGSFTVPLRVAVRNDVTQKVMYSQLTQVGATIPPGSTEGAFTFVSEPFSVPFAGRPGDDYTILVGFDPSGGGSAAPRHPRRRRP